MLSGQAVVSCDSKYNSYCDEETSTRRLKPMLRSTLEADEELHLCSLWLQSQRSGGAKRGWLECLKFLAQALSKVREDIDAQLAMPPRRLVGCTRPTFEFYGSARLGNTGQLEDPPLLLTSGARFNNLLWSDVREHAKTRGYFLRYLPLRPH